MHKQIVLFLVLLIGCSSLAQKDKNGLDTLKSTHTFEPSMENSMNNPIPDADVVFVKALEEANGTWTFHVTISHPDTGWEDFADGWNIVLPSGEIILPNPSDKFTRVLLHPHVNEQPFTRSQSNIVLPEQTEFVIVKGHDLVSGFGGKEVKIYFNSDKDENYQIIRNID